MTNLKRGVDVEMRVAAFLLLHILITFTLCVGKVKFPLLLFSSSVLFSSELAMQDFHPYL